MSFDCFPNITFRLFKSSTGRDAAGQVGDIRRPVAVSLHQGRVSGVLRASGMNLSLYEPLAARLPIFFRS